MLCSTLWGTLSNAYFIICLLFYYICSIHARLGIKFLEYLTQKDAQPFPEEECLPSYAQ